MLIGDMRVSKADGSQTNDLQRDALISAGVEVTHIYEDRVSGKQEERPGLSACLKALRSGDTLLVWKLDRLGRDVQLSIRQHLPVNLYLVFLQHWLNLNVNSLQNAQLLVWLQQEPGEEKGDGLTK